jgi:hypothetical protein
MRENGRTTVARRWRPRPRAAPRKRGSSRPNPASAAATSRGAGILSIGIATTGVVTFAYFAVASHILPEVQYKGISLLWS